MVAVVLWGGLLGLGLWSLLTREEQPRLRLVLGLTLLGQLALHLVYGNETVLYALHFGPLLVVMAALTTLTRLRLLGLALAGMLVISAGVNNGVQFTKAIELFESFGPPRRQVALQMQRRRPSPGRAGGGTFCSLAQAASRVIRPTTSRAAASVPRWAASSLRSGSLIAREICKRRVIPCR
jgi:hypothetical protein